MPNIKPVSDLRNYGEVLRDVAVGQPVFLTRNGHGRYAVLDMEEYRDLHLTIAVFTRLLEQPKMQHLEAGIVLQAYLPDLAASLGVFIPLIVVNCIILGRAEAFASKNRVWPSFLDGLFQGIGYTAALVVMCVIREFLGSGTFGGGILNGGEGIRIIPEGYPAMQMVMPVGGFLTLGFLIAFFQWMMKRIAAKQKEAAKK